MEELNYSVVFTCDSKWAAHELLKILARLGVNCREFPHPVNADRDIGGNLRIRLANDKISGSGPVYVGYSSNYRVAEDGLVYIARIVHVSMLEYGETDVDESEEEGLLYDKSVEPF